MALIAEKGTTMPIRLHIYRRTANDPTMAETEPQTFHLEGPEAVTHILAEAHDTLHHFIGHYLPSPKEQPVASASTEDPEPEEELQAPDEPDFTQPLESLVPMDDPADETDSNSPYNETSSNPDLQVEFTEDTDRPVLETLADMQSLAETPPVEVFFIDPEDLEPVVSPNELPETGKITILGETVTHIPVEDDNDEAASDDHPTDVEEVAVSEAVDALDETADSTSDSPVDVEVSGAELTVKAKGQAPE